MDGALAEPHPVSTVDRLRMDDARLAPATSLVRSVRKYLPGVEAGEDRAVLDPVPQVGRGREAQLRDAVAVSGVREIEGVIDPSDSWILTAEFFVAVLGHDHRL